MYDLETGSVVGQTRPSADEAIARIVDQHATIRLLLEAAGTVADLAAMGSRRVADLLPHYLEKVRAALEEHLASEEELLVPILMADPPLGPDRAVRLYTEHARQRAELAALARSNDHPVTLARRLRALIDAFVADMTEEEHFLLTRDVLRDDLVSVDQECG